ncbi:MAG: trehalose synthase [Microbacteriaceae bacterium]|nr:trehalose synthase [Microbacteriaceae bacterium]
MVQSASTVLRMRITDTSDLWWKTAVVYCLDVETYLDWNGDGTGDFEGLSHRIDYLAELGITCLWLMPFYPTPNRDDGYDISDYYGVDPRLGHLGDFVEVVRTARDRGIRVIVDLVVNHTSDQHPWFKASRSSRDSAYRDWYVWRDEPPEHPEATAFPGEETSTWQFDEKTGQYYLHNFYHFQPDLNVTNPLVRDEVAKVMGFWLQLGVTGFRVDAVPFFLDTEGVEPGHGQLKNPLEYLKSLHAFLERRSGEAIMLGEVNLARSKQLSYFGGEDADGLTMQFDFIGMQNLFLSLARQDARPLAAALAKRPVLPQANQWANFVRNHDELTLDKLTPKQRDEVFAAFAPDADEQIYGRGIIRRLGPMLLGDPRRIRMVYSLLFSMPGTPVLFYGQEIGMGEDLARGDREAVRTPMQWTHDANGGFSDAPASKLAAPMVSGGYSPEHVNVASQRHDQDSLLHFIRRLVERYRASAEIGWGDFTLLDQPNNSVLAHTMSGDEGRMLAVHNFSAEPAVVTVALYAPDTRFVDLLRDGSVTTDTRGRLDLSLEGYGYRWLRQVGPNEKRLF